MSSVPVGNIQCSSLRSTKAALALLREGVSFSKSSGNHYHSSRCDGDGDKHAKEKLKRRRFRRMLCVSPQARQKHRETATKAAALAEHVQVYIRLSQSLMALDSGVSLAKPR